MLRGLRSLLRLSFAFTAMFLIPASLYVLFQTLGTRSGRSAHFSSQTTEAALAVGILFALASYSTRNGGRRGRLWGILASLLQIATGLFVARFTRGNFSFTSPEPLLVAAGVAGLFVFSRSAPESKPSTPAKKREPVPGDRTSLWFDRLAAILFIVATWQAVGAWYPWARTRGLSTVSGIPLVLLISAVALITAVLHECGHAFAARVFHMRLLGFNAGPFQWWKQEGKWKLHFKTSGILGGSVTVVPTHPDQPRWHDVVMIAAGPLVNIATAPFFFFAATHAQGTRWQPFWFFFAIMGSTALLVAGFNLLPFRTTSGSYSYSDGARILQLLTNSPIIELQRTMRRIQSTTVTPLRPRDLDPVALQNLAAAYPRELAGLQLQLCAADSYEDQSRFPEARAALAAAQAIDDNFILDLSRSLHAAFILDYALLNRDAAKARLWFQHMVAKKPEPVTIDFWLARAALLWIEGRLPEAEVAWQQADARARQLPHFGAYEFARDRCARLRHELDIAAAKPTVQSPSPTPTSETASA